MRWPALCGALPLLIGISAVAAEVKTSSRIDHVTVFPVGAEVTRIAKLNIDAGENTLVIGDLPAGAHSIRIEGVSEGELELGAVDVSERELRAGDPAVDQSAREKLET
jgi:hypothetical protein